MSTQEQIVRVDDTKESVAQKLVNLAATFEGRDEVMKQKISDLVTHINTNVELKDLEGIKRVIENFFIGLSEAQKAAYNEGVKNIVVAHFERLGIRTV